MAGACSGNAINASIATATVKVFIAPVLPARSRTYPATRSRQTGDRRSVQQLLMAKVRELTAILGNFNRRGIKLVDAADHCSCSVDGGAGAYAGGLPPPP